MQKKKLALNRIAVANKINVAVVDSGNKYCLIALALCLLYGCFDKIINIQYDSSTHTLKELNGNSFRNVSLNEVNSDSSIACTIYYYKKLTAKSINIINLDRIDTAYFEMNNSLNCKFKKGNKYMLIANFIGQSDTIQIIW